MSQAGIPPQCPSKCWGESNFNAYHKAIEELFSKEIRQIIDKKRSNLWKETFFEEARCRKSSDTEAQLLLLWQAVELECDKTILKSIKEKLNELMEDYDSARTEKL